jgi:hypothetical protein
MYSFGKGLICRASLLKPSLIGCVLLYEPLAEKLVFQDLNAAYFVPVRTRG